MTSNLRARRTASRNRLGCEPLEDRSMLSVSALTVDILDVAPAEQVAGVSGIQIVFSEPVNDFDLGDLTLDRSFDGLGNLLVGSAATLNTADNQTFVLGNTTGITGGLGQYILSIDSTTATVTAVSSGDPLSNNDFTVWERISRFQDWGDAPDPTFPTLAASGGAFHEIVPGFFLGARVDPERDGFPSADALGDDLLDRDDDEDGVTFIDPIAAGTSADIEIVASAAGKLDAWIDFDGNGFVGAERKDRVLHGTRRGSQYDYRRGSLRGDARLGGGSLPLQLNWRLGAWGTRR